MPRALNLLLLLLLLAAGPLAGCGLEDPYTADRDDGRGSRPPARFDEENRREQAHGDELAPTAPTGESAPAYAGTRASKDPERVVHDFCAQWANWSYRTIERQQRRLAELSTRRLARALGPSSAQRALDDTLERDRFAVRGQVVAVDLRPAAERRRAVCVTREEEFEQGRDALGDGVHRVYFARLERNGKRWSVAAWQPQP